MLARRIPEQLKENEMASSKGNEAVVLPSMERRQFGWQEPTVQALRSEPPGQKERAEHGAAHA